MLGQQQLDATFAILGANPLSMLPIYDHFNLNSMFRMPRTTLLNEDFFFIAGGRESFISSC
jgi:hypothetical protein